MYNTYIILYMLTCLYYLLYISMFIGQVSPYPEEEAMQNDLLTKLNWDAQREAILENTVSHIKLSLHRASK